MSGTTISDSPTLPLPPECDCSNVVIFPDSSFPRCCSKQRLWWMLHSQKLCDISFVVGPDSQTKTLHAHQNVLSAGSSVFESMFSGNWAAESSIRVPDVEPSAFSILLRFIYIDDAPLTVEIASQVLYAAKKYAVFVLEMQCSEFLQKNLCPKNAFTILVQAKLLNDESLAESCLDIIDETAEVAMSCEDFLEIDFPTLCEVLKRDTMNVNETALFDAAVRWATAECSRKGLEVTRENQRSLLEGALPLIRFPLMTQKEFTTSVAKSGIFNHQELVDMYYYFSGCSEAPFKYNTTPRSSKELLIAIIASRFESVDARTDYEMKSNDYETLQFYFSKNVKLRGFGLYIGGRVENFNLNLYLYENGKLIYTETPVQFVTTGHEIHHHYLKTAIPAMADKRYCILIQSKETVKHVAGFYASCTFCGYLSLNFANCEGCKRKLPGEIKMVPTANRKLNPNIIITRTDSPASTPSTTASPPISQLQDLAWFVPGSNEQNEITVTDPSGQRSVNIRFVTSSWYVVNGMLMNRRSSGLLSEIIFHW